MKRDAKVDNPDARRFGGPTRWLAGIFIFELFSGLLHVTWTVDTSPTILEGHPKHSQGHKVVIIEQNPQWRMDSCSTTHSTVDIPNFDIFV
jgi:hypothetical protein